MKYAFALAALLLISACAYQAPLKTPSEIAHDEVQAREKAADVAKRDQKRAERDAKRARDLGTASPASSQPESQVIVPEGSY